jgi:prolipoprotein diacylglyceryltransferase
MERDPLLGPVLSAVIYGLILCISFLVATLPFSAVLRSDPGVTAGVIATLTAVLGLVIQARGRVADRDQ